MVLPTCIKVEGRYIGRLITYQGCVAPQHSEDVRLAEFPEFFVDKISWTGRLWRDSEISQEQALAETIRHVSEWKGLALAFGDKGFGLFDRVADETLVNLIGVLPRYCGQGIAKTLILDAAAILGPQVRAGTYDNNEAARRLYRGLGMKPIRTEHVFHR